MKRILIATILLALLTSSAFAQSNVIFTNPYDWESTNAYSSFYGSNFFNQSFTDYYTCEAVTITDFHWWGVPWYDNADIDGFNFQIYNSAAGAPLPGDLLYEEFISGDVGATFTGDQTAGYDVYSYGFDLATPFVADASSHYWFSVVAYQGGNMANWFWALGNDFVFDPDWQHAYIGGDDFWVNPDESDFAFTITGDGTVVPEPTTLLLLGLGLAGVAWKRRK